MQFQEIILSRINLSKLNPRKTINPEKDLELQASIAASGVLQPVLVRPIGNGVGLNLEIVCGERRFRAKCKIAETHGGLDHITIPAIIQEMTDNEALEAMIIENLQREDLNDLDEAKGFKIYIEKLQKKDKDTVETLATRIGKSPGYIRKRVAVMQLPKKVLDAWDKGKLHFGHLEQFIRASDKKERTELISHTISNQWSVQHLKSQIDSRKPKLKNAIFDTKKTKCFTCPHNTHVQHKLFAIDEEKTAHCMNPKCFITATREHLSKNWKKTKQYQSNKTNGFKFSHELGYNDYEHLYAALIKAGECKKCENFVTIIDLTGDNDVGKACIDPVCYKKVQNKINKDSTGANATPDERKETRAKNHGQYFREKFYDTRIPEIISNDIKADSEVAARLTLFAMIKKVDFLRPWFSKKIKTKKDDKVSNYYGYSNHQLFAKLEDLKLEELRELLKEASMVIVLEGSFHPEGRQVVAEHLKIDLKKEWIPGEEYLNKKFKPELLVIGHKFKIFEQQIFKDYIGKKYGKTVAQIETLKKPEIVSLFLKSGADLNGVVPDEILNVK